MWGINLQWESGIVFIHLLIQFWFVILSKMFSSYWTHIHYINHRRINRNEAIHSISWSKKNTFCVLTLWYNCLTNIQTLINYIEKHNHSHPIDLIIIDNSNNSLQADLHHKSVNIQYIRPKWNLGSAWWYALGMEYVISQWYKWFTMIEDDILLSEDDILTKTYNSTKDKQLVFINPCLNTGWEHSRYVQYACYPIDFITKIGVINPTYFFRSEDLERKIRIEKWIQKYWYSKLILNKDYLHPYLKRVNWSSSWSYFSIRNQLLMHEEHFNRWIISFFITIIVYIQNSLTHLILFQNISYFKAIWLWIRDFIFWKTLQTNYKRLSQLSNKTIIWNNQNTISIEHFNAKYWNYALLLPKKQFSETDLNKLQYSGSIKHFFQKWTIIGWRNSILLPIILLSNSIMSIDEFNLQSDEIYISEYSNKHKILYYFVLILILWISWIIWICMITFVFFKILLYKITWIFR